MQTSARVMTVRRIDNMLRHDFIKEWAIPGLFFVKQASILFLGTTNEYENVHIVYGAGIRTHNLFLKPLDQGPCKDIILSCKVLPNN